MVQEPIVVVERVSEAEVQPQSNLEAEAKAYIYFKESSNKLDAVNKSSGACGIGQSLPCTKLSSVCPNWQTDYECQNKWFTNYMINRYGSWSNARVFHLKKGWW